MEILIPKVGGGGGGKDGTPEGTARDCKFLISVENFRIEFWKDFKSPPPLPQFHFIIAVRKILIGYRN